MLEFIDVDPVLLILGSLCWVAAGVVVYLVARRRDEDD
jgi:hypothetical protein